MIAGKELRKEMIVPVVHNVVVEKSQIVATRLAEATCGDSPSEPEWLEGVVSVDLARPDFRHSELARRLGSSFRIPCRFAPTDNITTVSRRSGKIG